MTPAIEQLKRAGIAFTLHEYAHDPAVTAFGEETVRVLGVSPEVIYKTLVVALNCDPKTLALAILPVAYQLNLKCFAKAAGAKKCELAPQAAAERATGYIVGGISPFAQRKRLPAYLDSSASQLATLYVSAGRRGMQLELAPAAILQLCHASYADIADRA